MKTGTAPSIAMQLVDATNEFGGVMTSSPGPTPTARNPSTKRNRSGSDADNVLRAAQVGEALLERSRGGPQNELAVVDHVCDRCEDRAFKRCVSGG
jgi:hypothetical protein